MAKKARDAGATAYERGHDAAEKISPMIEQARQTWREKSPEFRVSCERAANWARETRERLHVYAEKYAPLIEETVRDERTKNWIKDVVATTVQVNLRMDMSGDEKTEKWVDLLAKMPIVTSEGPTTLEEFASKQLLSRCPALAESDVVNRPSSLAVAFLTRNTEQMRNLKIVPMKGQYMSVNDILRQVTPWDLQQADKAIDVVQSIDELENAIISTGDVSSAAQKMLNSINAMKGNDN